MNTLENVLESGDKDLIHLKLDELNTYTQPFAHRVMDHVMLEAMKGKHI
jgi:molecular chaperone HscA